MTPLPAPPPRGGVPPLPSAASRACAALTARWPRLVPIRRAPLSARSQRAPHSPSPHSAHRGAGAPRPCPSHLCVDALSPLSGMAPAGDRFCWSHPRAPSPTYAATPFLRSVAPTAPDPAARFWVTRPLGKLTPPPHPHTPSGFCSVSSGARACRACGPRRQLGFRRTRWLPTGLPNAAAAAAGDRVASWHPPLSLCRGGGHGVFT